MMMSFDDRLKREHLTLTQETRRYNLEVTMLKILKFATVAALLGAPVAVHAQGVIGGMQRGAAHGNAAAGPLGAIAGSAVGGAVGGVNGALGVPGPRYHRHWYEHRSAYRHHRHHRH
jgi:hypothetical protein